MTPYLKFYALPQKLLRADELFFQHLPCECLELKHCNVNYVSRVLRKDVWWILGTNAMPASCHDHVDIESYLLAQNVMSGSDKDFGSY